MAPNAADPCRNLRRFTHIAFGVISEVGILEPMIELDLQISTDTSEAICASKIRHQSCHAMIGGESLLASLYST
jgi:hypothetical protein